MSITDHPCSGSLGDYMKNEGLAKILKMCEEEQEFISAMKAKNEHITPDKIIEAISWINHCLENDDIDEAIRFSIAAAAMSKYLKDLPHLVEAAMQRGVILTYSEKYKEAIEQYRDVLKILKRPTPISGFCKDKEAEAICYANIGELYNRLGMIEKAKEPLQKSITITDSFNLPALAQSNHIELGTIYLDTGYIQDALHHFEKALSFCSPGEEGYIDILLNIANAYADIGFTDKAHSTLDEALSHCERQRDDEARIYTNKGYLFAQDENWEKSLTYSKKALKIARETNNKESEALILVNVANVLHKQNNAEAAATYYKKSLALHKEYSNKEGQAAAYYGLGIIAEEKGEYTTALTHYATAETLLHELGHSPQLQTLYQTMGLLFHHTHDLDNAVALYEKSIDLLEKMRTFSEREEIQMRFTGEREDVYGYMIAALLELNGIDNIFQYIERAKAYTLTNLLEKKRVFATHKDLTEYQNLRTECDILYSRKIRYIHWPDRLNVQLLHNQSLLEDMKKKIRLKYPENADLLGFNTVDTQKIKNYLQDSVFIEYYVFIDGVCAVILGKDMKAAEVIGFTSDTVKRFDRREFIKKFMDRKWSLLRDTPELYTILFLPLEKYLKEGQHICIAPHGVLHYVPFHALFDGEQYLIEKYKISYSPSAAVLRYCMERDIKKSHQYFVTGGKNELMEEEACEVANLLKTPVYEPLRPVFEKNCGNKDIIHIACHGKFFTNDPFRSCIVFGDEPLDAHHIFNVNIHADLVVLSACETGVSEVGGGDELIGLTRAFLAAGAKSLIHSLWPVSSRSTKELMVKFYDNLLTGQSKVDSLRNAQLDLLHTERFTNPYHWAPFVLAGDWH